MKKQKCQAISKSTQNQCENNALKDCNYCWVHYPKKESIEFFIFGLLLTFLLQLTYDIFTVSPEESNYQALQTKVDYLGRNNIELIEGKNKLIELNNQLVNNVNQYKTENAVLKSQIDSLTQRTKNFDTLSDKKTRIGDLLLSREGTTLNINTIDGIISKGIRDAQNFAKEGSLDKAISTINNLEKSYPNKIPEGAIILKVMYICKKGDYNLAITTLKKLDEKRISSENAQMYFSLLGFCYGKQDNYELAAKYLRLAIENNKTPSRTEEAQKNLRIIERKMGKG